MNKSFTDRFIKIPVDLYDTTKAEMVGYNSETKIGETIMRILPFEISHYRPAIDDNDEMKNILIHMKNADSFFSSLTIEEFEKILSELE